ncbi:DUF1491 family protein [Erythrobacter arachoides]|uniref:DUF1491 family protein n=1 Tax=Aurantiacibacter arachoides TaxID=1850444 RepID=A0A845A3E0_9SPHN|nr:DUF1491 family protein [Aurantiacibacter arachoides]MXO94635.1 DUF1491 family protein [Aurantiacibacter arachoides]GGD61946.1 hypothetical protein GCM10011411_22700 [Aurantiacibacter arachoides]
MDQRLPAHLEVSGLVRQVQAAGGFAMVLAKGERDAGTLLIICCENGTKLRAYERMPQSDGSRKWTLAKCEDPENRREFSDWYGRRQQQDSDLWIVEIDVANAERFLDGGIAQG